MAIIKIRGISVNMLLDIAPVSYGLYVTMDRKGIKKLITQCMNTIYGTVVAIILYYCKRCKALKLNKFHMNPYDPCVANRLVNLLQQSIIFHVDNCKLIHRYPKLNDILVVVIR